MNRYGKWMLFCLAALAFLAPLKFGTPVVLQSVAQPPRSAVEWVLFGWPNQIGVMLVFAICAWWVLDSNRLVARVDALFVLPILFLATQLLALPDSINPNVSAETLVHFAMCVLLFYTAAWYVRDGASAARVFGGLGLAMFVVLSLSLDQRFGGLQEAREMVALYHDRVPTDLVARVQSNRVFGTLVYPNTLAGYLVLAFAPTMAWIWSRARTWNARLRWPVLGFVGALIVWCLLLTGSRGGFVAFAAGVIAGVWCLLPQRSRRAIYILLITVAVLGAVLLIAVHRGWIGLGLSSWRARLDYWLGAAQIARAHPWIGTGPGTFGSVYPQYKTAYTEETQLVHNNFLQMWSDSGVFAFFVFAMMWLVALRDVFALAQQRRGDMAAVAITAALTGAFVHGLVDFDLYVPGVAVPMFLLLGVVQGLKEVPNESSGAVPWAGGVACAILVGAVLWWESQGLAANFAYGRALELRAARPTLALAEAEEAARLAPRNAYYQSTAGDLAVEAGLFTRAIDHYKRAIENDPNRASYHWRLARAHLSAFGPDGVALTQARLAAMLNPTNPRYQRDAAEIEESLRQSESSLLESNPAKE